MRVGTIEVKHKRAARRGACADAIGADALRTSHLDFGMLHDVLLYAGSEYSSRLHKLRQARRRKLPRDTSFLDDIRVLRFNFAYVS